MNIKTLVVLSIGLAILPAACSANDAGHDTAIPSGEYLKTVASREKSAAHSDREAASSRSGQTAAGSVVTAEDCSFNAVQTAVRSSTAGMTVRIPAGTCSWGAQQLDIDGGIHLRGAGKNATIIRRIGRTPEAARLIKFDCSNGKRAVFSDMTLMGNGMTTAWESGLGLYKCVDFKVFNSKFTGFTFAAVFVEGSNAQRGVIYHNEFIDNYSPLIKNVGYGVKVDGDDTWTPLELGTQNAVFVEDNYFSGNRHNISSLAAAKYVFRYNKVVATDLVKDYAMVDAHGKASGRRGSRSWEIYNNLYSANLTRGTERTAIGIRGGDGVAFNNTMVGNIGRPIELWAEGFACGTYPGPDQIRSAYFWHNTTRGVYAEANGISNTCTDSIKLGRDYFTTRKPGYRPFIYPHPLRGM